VIKALLIVIGAAAMGFGVWVPISIRRSADPAQNPSSRMGLMKAAGAALVGGAAIIWIALTL
jgi:hypothetical protein